MDTLDGFGIFQGSALEHMVGLNPNTRRMGKEASHFSFWSYNHYWECPLRYFWITVDKKLPTAAPDKRSSLEGGAMHLALDKLIKARPDDIGGWVSEHAQESFDEYLAEIKDGFKWKSQMDGANAYEKYLKLLLRASMYVKHKVFDDPMVKEIHSELPFLAKVTPTITVGGRMDLLLIKQAHPDTPPFIDIVDWKGTSNVGSTSREQLMFYGIGGMAVKHLPVRFVSFAYPALNREQMFRFNDSDYEAFVYKIKVVAEKAALGERVAATEISSCKWCAYKDQCDQQPQKERAFGRDAKGKKRGS